MMKFVGFLLFVRNGQTKTPRFDRLEMDFYSAYEGTPYRLRKLRRRAVR